MRINDPVARLREQWLKSAAAERADNWCNTEDAPIWKSIHRERAMVFEACAAQLSLVETGGGGAPVSPTDIIKGGVDFIMGPPVSPAEPPPNYEDLYYAEALQRAAAEERAAQAEQERDRETELRRKAEAHVSGLQAALNQKPYPDEYDDVERRAVNAEAERDRWAALATQRKVELEVAEQDQFLAAGRINNAETAWTHAEQQLAECYRLSGADPDGNENHMLAPYAVEEVKRLRQEFNEDETQLVKYEQDLKAAKARATQLEAYVRHRPECEISHGHTVVYPEPVPLPSIRQVTEMEHGRLAKGLPTANRQRTSSRPAECTCGLAALLAEGLKETE